MQIRNFYLAILMMLLFTSMSNAQFGVRAGVNLAGQSYDMKNNGQGRRLGFAFGLNYKVQVTDAITIQPEMNFIQQGYTQTFEDIFEGMVEFSANLGYLQIPVLGKYTYNINDIIGVYAQAGPYLGLGFGKVYYTLCEGDDCLKTEYEYGEDSNIDRVDFGAHLGAGINLYNKISWDFRYILGLKDVDQDGTIGAKNNGLFFSIGYTF